MPVTTFTDFVIDDVTPTADFAHSADGHGNFLSCSSTYLGDVSGTHPLTGTYAWTVANEWHNSGGAGASFPDVEVIVGAHMVEADIVAALPAGAIISAINKKVVHAWQSGAVIKTPGTTQSVLHYDDYGPGFSGDFSETITNNGSPVAHVATHNINIIGGIVSRDDLVAVLASGADTVLFGERTSSGFSSATANGNQSYQADYTFTITIEVTWTAPPTPPARRPATGSGVLALPALNLDAVAAGDPIAMRDALSAISRTMQEFAIDLAASLKRVRWVPQPWSSSLYTAEGAGTWVVLDANQVEFDYVRLGDILFMQIFLTATSTLAGGTFTSLYIQMPGGYRVQAGVQQHGWCVIGETDGAEEIGLVAVDGSEANGQPVDKIRIRRLPLGTDVSDGLTASLSIRAVIQFRIVPPPAAQ